MSPKKFDIVKNLALVTQLGISMALPIVAGVFIGSKLDEYFGTQPILLIICLIVFSIASFINLFKIAGIKNKKRTKYTEDKIENIEKKEDSKADEEAEQ